MFRSRRVVLKRLLILRCKIISEYKNRKSLLQNEQLAKPLEVSPFDLCQLTNQT